MKISDRIKNTLLTGCMYYTIVSLLMYAISLYITRHEMVPTFKSLCMVLAASVSVAALNNIFRLKKILPAIALIIHFAGSSVMFYLIFIRISGLYTNGYAVIIGLSLFVFVYAIVVSSVFLIKKISRRRENIKSEYKNQFDNVSMKK